MHIGIVLPAVPGYSETFFRNKIEGLQKNGLRVTLFVKNPKGAKDFICKVKVHPNLSKHQVARTLQSFFFFFILMIKAPTQTIRMLNITRQQGYSFFQSIKAAVIGYAILPQKLDWLHFGFATPAIEREFIGAAIGAKVAVSFRGFDLNQIPLTEGNPYKKLWPQVDKAHSISEYLVERAYALGMPNNTPYTIITPAIDANRFTSKAETRIASSVLLVSRLHWIKGIEGVLQALAIVKNQGFHFSLTIAGEGDERERLVFAAYQLGILDDVTFVGRKSPDEVIALMQAHEVFIQYSHQEGFCNAALEAQATEMLCVVSDADGLKENVLDGQTGWVVPKRNPEALAKTLTYVFGLAESEKQNVRMHARTRVLKEFTIEKQAQAFVDFYSV